MFYSVNRYEISNHTQYKSWNKDIPPNSPWCKIELDGPSVYIGVTKQGNDFLVFDTGSWGKHLLTPDLEVPPFVEVTSTGNVKASNRGFYGRNCVFADVNLRDPVTEEAGVVRCCFEYRAERTLWFSEDGTVMKISRTTLGCQDVHSFSSSNQDFAWQFADAIKANYDLPSGETSKEAAWGYFLKGYLKKLKFDDRGVKKVEAQFKETLDRLESERPHLYRFFRFLHDGSSYEKTTNNRLLAVFLETHGSDYERVVSELVRVQSEVKLHWRIDRTATRLFCKELPGAKDKLETEKAKTEWQYRKGAREQALGLGIDPSKHKRLLEAVEAKKFPLTLFHKAGQPEHVINVEFDLWERALKRPGWSEVLLDIAADAARRTTYEKNVTPYFAFLFHIEKYLKRHTGKVWKAMPKFVSSQWELEMDEDAKGGATSSKRSALTPIADNETRTITVPYASLTVTGVRTTYCYSLKYYVLEENTLDVLTGDPIQNELECKLNGRDDYGLMYYTLTGSPPATGYPSFLIIFEKVPSKEIGVRVHFHRVHPNRSKSGVPTPACRLIEECYRYMAGNVRAEDIHAQQGDLIFIRTEDEPPKDIEGKPVSDFESHKFIPSSGGPLMLYEKPVKAIKNRLGFLFAAVPFTVSHPEHEDLVAMPAGLYEIRRCRTWEANPRAVWSYTFD